MVVGLHIRLSSDVYADCGYSMPCFLTSGTLSNSELTRQSTVWVCSCRRTRLGSYNWSRTCRVSLSQTKFSGLKSKRKHWLSAQHAASWTCGCMEKRLLFIWNTRRWKQFSRIRSPWPKLPSVCSASCSGYSAVRFTTSTGKGHFWW